MDTEGELSNQAISSKGEKRKSSLMESKKGVVKYVTQPGILLLVNYTGIFHTLF